ncbi:MAG: Acetyl-coenzyme A synthetase [Gammaproteobacteria bacterium]|nr:Acetyl-coenzyme A synthetase [Gammaproteobacteria bacterium]
MALISSDYRDFESIRKDFRWSIPERYNMARDVCERHSAIADRPALYYENAAGERRVYTFGDLKTLSNRLANALAHWGIEKGDRVGIVLPQRLETGLAHIAIHKLGAVSLPLSILFGPDAIEYRLKDSGAKAVITLGRHADMIRDIEDRLPNLEIVISCDESTGDARFWPALDRASDRFEVVDTLADDPALLIYTSGTTGPPKGALVAHRSLIGNLPGFELSQNFYPKPGDVFWTPADWAWTGGLLDGLLPAWYYGTPIVGFEGGKFDPDHAVDLIERYGVTNSFIPPTALKMIRQVPDLESRPLELRGIMSAGETLGGELYEWGESVLDLKINEMWGQTEFNYLVGNSARIMEVKPGSMGRPYPGHEVDAIDNHGNVVARGEPGELAARVEDPVMFLGYWEDEKATKEKIGNGWFRTGDVGYRDQDGYIWFVGRKDDVISTAGYRVGPGEIEDCLLKHPAVAQAAVIGKPDELRGNVIKAFIVLARGHSGDEALKQDIQDTVKNRLAAYEYPREIDFIDEMPMTTTGKIKRMELRERVRNSEVMARER